VSQVVAKYTTPKVIVAAYTLHDCTVRICFDTNYVQYENDVL